MSDSAAPQTSALSKQELDDFTSKLVIALKTVFDPEIPVDIYELGLIYKVDVAGNKDVTVDMTLIRSAYTPDSFQVREGDQVTLKVTNVETIRDMIHGFALPDHNLNIALAPGFTKTITFEAGKPVARI